MRDNPIPGETVLDALLAEIPMPAGEARGYLARFLFRGDDAFKEVRRLSGGERSRLELALLGIMPANLLLLDEPTNHLDIPAREALEAFLRETTATILVVSHDRRLLETVCDRLWVVDDGRIVPFEGGYRSWRAAASDGWRAGEAYLREMERFHGRGAGLASGDGGRDRTRPIGGGGAARAGGEGPRLRRPSSRPRPHPPGRPASRSSPRTPTVARSP